MESQSVAPDESFFCIIIAPYLKILMLKSRSPRRWSRSRIKIPTYKTRGIYRSVFRYPYVCTNIVRFKGYYLRQRHPLWSLFNCHNQYNGILYTCQYILAVLMISVEKWFGFFGMQFLYLFNINNKSCAVWNKILKKLRKNLLTKVE